MSRSVCLCVSLVILLVSAVSVTFGQDAAKGSPRVLILGNSITRHGPKADIDWHTNWGMAASALEKDFSHILIKYFTEANGGKAPEHIIENISGFERGYVEPTYDVAKAMARFVAFKPTIIILCIGENVADTPTAEKKEAFYQGLMKLLNLFKTDGAAAPKLIVRSSFWPSANKDGVLKRACESYGGTFVDIGPIGRDKSNYAISERPYKHAGVGNHPGDKGMQAIADAIWKAVR